ncbi:Tim44 domain-containing protein [Ralstonia pseudosolanacearum]|uniref:Tim44 domain-containing protein n=1 Tax=Ralstonia pseudosolanacearum TaxID=1310165 RepID=UPI0013F4DE38|nr:MULTISPECIES: Tim44 domain-containing protein [Ralstonia]MCK4150768.1 Tim44 domain-containing protein [Ralstonia pseudosolanacearum]MDO3621943.1 Tim44 domain-containing protein [Ralstonia pseudosolanacearum]QIK19645.1 Tim44 domain-containing protein [Ralstonia solanacearum]UZF24558.1 Tim44 domain-containing protein [Ralstonia sp. RS642]
MKLHWGGKLVTAALVATLALGAAMDANAKRIGGGSRSFGKQSSTVTQRQQTPPTTPAPTQQQAAPNAQPSPAAPAPMPAQQPRRNWGAMLGGLAAGLGLGYLLSKFGLGAGLASLLSNLILIAIIAFVVMWIIRKLRGSRPQEPAYATGGPSLSGDREPYVPAPAAPAAQPAAPVAASTGTGSAGNTSGLGAGAQTAAQAWSLGGPAAPAANAPAAAPAAQQPWGVPADFDTQAFLRNAKVYFVRLQAAWDAGNLNDIREFTTPEMFAEIKMDLTDRGTVPNKTDVVSVEAELLGIETHPAEYLASVRFSGMIREETSAPAQPFAEVWNLTKPTQGSGGWVLAGIQQLQ